MPQPSRVLPRLTNCELRQCGPEQASSLDGLNIL